MKQTRFIGTDANVVSQSDSDGFENAEKAIGPRRQFDMTTILLVHAGIATEASKVDAKSAEVLKTEVGNGTLLTAGGGALLVQLMRVLHLNCKGLELHRSAHSKR
jgi:hypothetical protein